MKIDSKISKPPNGSEPLDTSRAEAIKRRRPNRALHPDAWFAPPRPRRRIREARRWYDELWAVTLNGRVCDRWPGQRLFVPSEGAEIRNVAIAELKERDPELYEALGYVIFWEARERSFTSLQEFKRQASNIVAHFTKIRLATRRPEFE